MKYVLIDQTTTDIFTKEFDNVDDAVSAGDRDFSMLTDIDKKNRTDFYLLESANPSEDAVDHLDGNVVKTWI